MKKRIVFYLITCALHTTAQTNQDFQHRFGPSSALYNQSLYFQREKNQDHRPRKRFRDQIRSKMRNKYTKQK